MSTMNDGMPTRRNPTVPMKVEFVEICWMVKSSPAVPSSGLFFKLLWQFYEIHLRFTSHATNYWCAKSFAASDHRVVMDVYLDLCEVAPDFVDQNVARSQSRRLKPHKPGAKLGYTDAIRLSRHGCYITDLYSWHHSYSCSKMLKVVHTLLKSWHRGATTGAYNASSARGNKLEPSGTTFHRFLERA